MTGNVRGRQLTLPGAVGESPHRGRPIVRHSPRLGRVLLLCPLGHLVQSVANADWPGSAVEANAGDPTFEVTCHGAAPGEGWSSRR